MFVWQLGYIQKSPREASSNLRSSLYTAQNHVAHGLNYNSLFLLAVLILFIGYKRLNKDPAKETKGGEAKKNKTEMIEGEKLNLPSRNFA